MSGVEDRHWMNGVDPKKLQEFLDFAYEHMQRNTVEFGKWVTVRDLYNMAKEKNCLDFPITFLVHERDDEYEVKVQNAKIQDGGRITLY